MSKESQPGKWPGVVEVLPLTAGNFLAACLDSPVAGPFPMVGVLEINEKENPPEMSVKGVRVDGNLQGAKAGDKVVVFTLR